MASNIKSTLSYYGRAAVSLIPRSYSWLTQQISPLNEQETLLKIERAAKKGFDQAVNPHVNKAGIEFKEKINATLLKDEGAKKAAAAKPLRGKIAKLPDRAENPDITEPLTPQSSDNWEKKMEEQRKRLSNKLIAFATLIQMRDRAGVTKDIDGNIEIDNLPLMDLVKRATETTEAGEPLPTLWELFTEHYELSWAQKIKAGWFYWIYYQTSLITNIIEAYLTAFIDHLEKGFTSESTRTVLFKAFLEDAKQFLIEDKKAIENFANGKETDLREARLRAIRERIQNDLPGLCAKVCEKQIEKACNENDAKTRVPFFRDPQKLWVIGLFFSFLEWALNRFVIKYAMKSQILPTVLIKGVENGLGATKPENLPFTIAMLKFFNGQLATYRDILDDQQNKTSSKKIERFPGTELLPATVKHLMAVLELVPLEDDDVALRQKFKEMEKAPKPEKKPGLWQWISAPLQQVDTEIQENIVNGVVEGGHTLFKYLSESAQKKELFANLLELSCLPFSGDKKSLKTLQTEYDKEQEALEKIADKVVNKLIQSAIHNTDLDPESSKKIGDELLAKRQKVLEEGLKEIELLCQSMEEKIDKAEKSPTSSNNIQKDLVSLFKILDVIASHKIFCQKVPDLSDSHNLEIWKQLHPIFEKLEKISTKALHLQKNQYFYPSYKLVEDELRNLSALLKKNKENFHLHPVQYQISIEKYLDDSLLKMTQALGEDAPAIATLTSYINEIKLKMKSEVGQHEILEALGILDKEINEKNALEEAKESTTDQPKTGLLQQLENFSQGVPSSLRDQIKEAVSKLPEKDQINDLLNEGVETRRWEPLKAALQHIYTVHRDQKIQHKAALDTLFEKAINYFNDKESAYRTLKNLTFAKMKEEIRTTLTEIQESKINTQNLTVDLTPTFNLKESTRHNITKVAKRAAIWFRGGEDKTRKVFSNAIKLCTGSSRDLIWEAFATHLLKRLSK